MAMWLIKAQGPDYNQKPGSHSWPCHRPAFWFETLSSNPFLPFDFNLYSRDLDTHLASCPALLGESRDNCRWKHFANWKIWDPDEAPVSVSAPQLRKARRGPSQETCPWKKSVSTEEEAGVLISFQELIVCAQETPDILQPHFGAVGF